MLRLVFFGLVCMFAQSTAKRKNDWVIVPATVLTGIRETASPYWDYRNNLLYYVAPCAKMIISWNPSSNETRTINVNEKPVFVFPTEDPNYIAVAFDDEIKKIGWDGKGDKKSEESLAKINDVGNDAKILAGSVSYNGNLTFIVKGKNNRRDAWFLFTMQLDQKPFKINFDRRGYTPRPLDGIFWTCAQPSMHLSSSVDAFVYKTRYNQQLGVTLYTSKQSWDHKYMPVGESKEDTDGNVYQIMNYKNDEANILQLRPNSKDADFAVSKVKTLTSATWGGPDLDILYIGSKKTNKDKVESAGGIHSCSTIGARGRPAFLVTSSLNPGINYCKTPKPTFKGSEVQIGGINAKGKGSISIKFNWKLSF